MLLTRFVLDSHREDIMGDLTRHRHTPLPSSASIDALSDDPAMLKALLRQQTEAFEALAEEAASFARPAGDAGFQAEQLQHLHRFYTLGTLTGGLAHEFNNILAAMLGFTEITKTVLPPDSPAQLHLQEVQTAGQRARELIRQALNYSRSAATASTPLAYAPLVSETLGLLRASLPKTIEIRDEITADVGDVLADPASMYQLLVNLCTNAAHALSASGLIEVKVDTCREDQVPAPVEVEASGTYIRLRIRDHGQGMTPEILERAFDPFFTTKAAHEGTGLGLTIVKRIVETYHGAIAVDSAPDTGTTVIVYLPQRDTSNHGLPSGRTVQFPPPGAHPHH